MGDLTVSCLHMIILNMPAQILVTLRPNLTPLKDRQHRIRDNAPGVGERNQGRGIDTRT
jgi:hypothetical protein